MSDEPTFLIDEDLLCKAVNKWGYEMQEIIAIEEMAELTHAIIKGKRDVKTKEKVEQVAEEIADVLIIVTQLALCQRSSVRRAIAWKLERLKTRLEE